MSNLNVVGVHTFITLDNDLALPISAVVVTELKEDIVIGTPFLKQNKMVIDFETDSIRAEAGKSYSEMCERNQWQLSQRKAFVELYSC